MKRLILMRHAKSAWDNPDLPDRDRPLNQRGKRDAPRIAQRLVTLEWSPQWVISSDSQRTTETWQLMEPAFDLPPEVLFTPNLYHGGIGDLLGELLELNDGVDVVLALGHNPGWEDAISFLAGKHERMTTANAALLSTPHQTWDHACTQPGAWELHGILRPKELDD